MNTQGSYLPASQWSNSQFSQQSLPSIDALGLASPTQSSAPQSAQSSQRSRGTSRTRGGRGSRGSRSVADHNQSGRHWTEQRNKDLLDILWIHAPAYNRIPNSNWFRRIQKHWKQKTGHDHASIKRRIQSMIDERRRAWRLRTETSGTENETDYTVSMDRFIREVWDRAAEENSAAALSAEAQRRQSRRTERDRERMTARGAQQRSLDDESDEDATSAADVDEFDTQSVNSEPVIDVDVEVSDSAARRGRGIASSVSSPTQRRRRGGSYGSSSSSVTIPSREELLVNLVAIADRAFPAAAAPTQMAPIAEIAELRTEVTQLKASIQRQEVMLAQLLRQQQPVPAPVPAPVEPLYHTPYQPNWFVPNAQNW